jgi:hypothetical protein
VNVRVLFKTRSFAHRGLTPESLMADCLKNTGLKIHRQCCQKPKSASVGGCSVEHSVDASVASLLIAPALDVDGWLTKKGKLVRYHGAGPGGTKSADYDEGYKGNKVT